MSHPFREHDIAPTASAERAPLCFSAHAARRAARRNVQRDGVAYVIAYGRLYHRTGVRFYFLGARDLPFEDHRNPWAARLIGTVVVVAPDSEVITTYRNRHAPRRIARKMKYRLFDEPYGRDALSAGSLAALGAIA